MLFSVVFDHVLFYCQFWVVSVTGQMFGPWGYSARANNHCLFGCRLLAVCVHQELWESVGIFPGYERRHSGFLWMKWCCTAGVMAARGLLANPAMFTGVECTTLECLQDWVCMPDMTLAYLTVFCCRASVVQLLWFVDRCLAAVATDKWVSYFSCVTECLHD